VSKGGGVIKDSSVHRRVVEDVLRFAEAQEFGVSGLLRSPLLGPKGNAEFLAWLTHPPGASRADLAELIAAVIPTDF
jgi:23S rRNA (cytidine1920-2'-O)/16S rRNA (cytidine1409-2'-O)-methyltransferase